MYLLNLAYLITGKSSKMKLIFKEIIYENIW
jgi:hypothetical protein